MIDEQDVGIMMRDFMTKWGYECLTENGTVKRALTVLRRRTVKFSSSYDSNAKNQYNELRLFGKE